MHLISKHYVPPLQAALGAEIHTRCGSQMLIEILHQFGVSCSAKTARQFERNAALQSTLESDNEFNSIKASVFAADNTDVQMATINGKRTFHGMGTIFAHVSKQSFSSNKIPKKTVKTEIFQRTVKVKSYSHQGWESILEKVQK